LKSKCIYISINLEKAEIKSKELIMTIITTITTTTTTITTLKNSNY